jgi:hypothetical protein
MTYKNYQEQQNMSDDEKRAYGRTNSLSHNLDPDYDNSYSSNSSSNRQYTGEFPWMWAFIFGGLFLLYNFVMGIIPFVTEVSFSNPIFFFTNPLWFMLALLFYMRTTGKIISALFLSMSLPLFTGLALFAFDKGIELITGNHSPMQILDVINQVYTSAYGATVGAEMQHFLTAYNLGKHSDLSNFMLSLNIINGVTLIAGFVLLYNCLFNTVGAITKYKYSLDEDLIGGFFGNIFLMGFTYFFCSTLINYTSGLPYGLDIISVWSILLFPFLGFRLALTNKQYLGDSKNSRIITCYYILFFLSIISFALYKEGSLMESINGSSTFKLTEEIFFILSPLASFYWLIRSLFSIKKS